MSEAREIRSMIFSSLHLPPMPTVVQQIDRDDNSVIDHEAVQSSHDIIACLIDFAMANCSPQENNKRQMDQLLLHYQFYEHLDSIQNIDSITDEDLYQLYADHTRHWIRAYTKNRNNHFAAIKGYDYVAQNDKIHLQTIEYAKAQSLINSDGRCRLEVDTSVPYLSLLRMCAKYAKESSISSTDMADPQSSPISSPNS